jgi:O-antigen biosynthesis protein WbqP
MAAVALAVPVLLVALAVRLTSAASALYWFGREGRQNKLFKMPKFRSMLVGTPDVATHLLADPKAHLTPNGRDELPQLWSILAGNMSFVEPRPAMFNQHEPCLKCK